MKTIIIKYHQEKLWKSCLVFLYYHNYTLVVVSGTYYLHQLFRLRDRTSYSI